MDVSCVNCPVPLYLSDNPIRFEPLGGATSVAVYFDDANRQVRVVGLHLRVTYSAFFYNLELAKELPTVFQTMISFHYINIIINTVPQSYL